METEKGKYFLTTCSDAGYSERVFSNLEDIYRALGGLKSPTLRFKTRFVNDGYAYVENENVYRRLVDSEDPYSGYVLISTTTVYQVYSRNGKAMNIQQIIAAANNLYSKSRGYYGYGRRFSFWNGEGPVPGISKMRGGGGYMRSLRTQSERSLNGLVVKEEGEVPARAARSGRNLPSSWDDFLRDRQKCWKEQRRGRKSWDR